MSVDDDEMIRITRAMLDQPRGRFVAPEGCRLLRRAEALTTRRKIMPHEEHIVIINTGSRGSVSRLLPAVRCI